MDDPSGAPAFCDFICRRSFPEQSMVASSVVHDWSCRRLDRVSRFATKSDRCSHDLLADSAPLGGNYVFCDLLLPRECRRLLESGLAIDCRSHHPRLYRTMSPGHPRNVAKCFYSDDCRGSGEYVAYRSVDRALIAGCDLSAIWTGAAAKGLAHGKRHRCRRHDRDFVGFDCARTGDSSRATTQPLAIIG